MVEVKKKEGESLDSLLRRFTKKVQASGVLLRAKKGRFYTSDPSKREVRERAKRRALILEKKEYLRKIGKLDEILERKKPGKRPRGIAKKILAVKINNK